MKTLIKSLFVFICISFTTNGLSETSFQSSNDDSLKAIADTLPSTDASGTDLVLNPLLKKIESFESNFNNYVTDTSKQTEQLESIIRLQNEKINFLNLRVEQLSAPTKNQKDFSGWISILLGCVAIIVTVLGVIIALLSFVGYKTAIKKAEDKATEIASITAAEIATATAVKIATTEIEKRVEDGSFNPVIEEAVQKLAYDTISTSDFDQIDDEHVD